MVFALGSLPKQGVPEIKVRYNRARKTFLGLVKKSTDAADFIRKTYTRGSIELQEAFVVLYCNHRNEILGYYRHSVGSISAALIDQRIILGTALKSASTSIVLAHNHPSGNLKPSQADIEITKKIKKAADLLDIKVLDHIIVTKKEYFSFTDAGLI